MNKKELFWLSNLFAFDQSSLVYTSARELEKLVEIFDKSLLYIKRSASARHIILESWLMLDYMIRLFFCGGLGINKFSTEEYNISQEILPQSFRDCVNALEKFIHVQKALPIDPEKDKVDLYGQFAWYVLRHQKDFYDKQFKPIVEEYYRKYHPHLANSTKTFPEKATSYLDLATATNIASNLKVQEPIQYRAVSEAWLETAGKLDATWFTNVRKINAVRNLAAHEIHSEKLYDKLGIHGSDEKVKLQKLKRFCITQLSQCLNITIAKRKKRKTK
nr:MAG: hypothetical protein EHM58_01270 [Ignavibacteriota bacterium]